MSTNTNEVEAIHNLLRTSALLVDNESFQELLKLFADPFRYRVKAYSTEIAAEMEWINWDRNEFKAMMDILNEHVRDTARRLHMVVPMRMAMDGPRAEVLSYFTIFRTTSEGATSCYAVGEYRDQLLKVDGRWQFSEREVTLHTRMLEIASHVPF